MLELLPKITARIQRAHHAARTGADDHIYMDTVFLQRLDDPDMRKASLTPTTQCQRDNRALRLHGHNRSGRRFNYILVLNRLHCRAGSQQQRRQQNKKANKCAHFASIQST